MTMLAHRKAWSMESKELTLQAGRSCRKTWSQRPGSSTVLQTISPFFGLARIKLATDSDHLSHIVLLDNFPTLDRQSESKFIIMSPQASPVTHHHCDSAKLCIHDTILVALRCLTTFPLSTNNLNPNSSCHHWQILL